MVEQIGIGFVALIFSVTTVLAICTGRFTCRGGATIRRADQPVEYWLVTLLFLACTCLLWIILWLIAFGFLKRWDG